MKKILITVITVCMLGGFALAQDAGELSVPFSNPGSKGKVKIDLRKGSIDVVGTDRKDVLVKYYSRAKPEDDKDKNKDGLKRISGAAMDLEISEKNNFIDIESDSWSHGVDLKIEVPRNVDLHVETYNNGYIFISNIEGEIVADNYNGKITADKISGSLVADTYNGEIKVSFDKITPDTPMAFTTYNGDVDLTLPSSFKASMKMKSNRGEIFSGFDFNVKKTEPVTKSEKKSGTYKVYLDDWVRADINGGGPEFMIKNYNGDIYLRKK